jgi:hypothetical protein
MRTAAEVDALSRLQAWIRAEAPTCALIATLPEAGSKRPLTAHKSLDGERLWAKWDASERQRVTHGGCDVLLLIRGDLIVLDCDDDDVAIALIEAYPVIEQTCAVATRRGRHFVFRRTPACDASPDGPVYDGAKLEFPAGSGQIKIDVKTVASTGTGGVLSVCPSAGKSWVRAPWDTAPLPLPDELLDFIHKHRRDAGHSRTKSRTSVAPATPSITEDTTNDDDVHSSVASTRESSSADASTTGFGVLTRAKTAAFAFDALERLVMALPPRFHGADSYDLWIRVIFVIHNISADNGYLDAGLRLAHEFSMQSPAEYNSNAVRKVWRSTSTGRPKHEQVKLPTLLMWVREHNTAVFEDVVALIDVLDGSSGATYPYELVKSAFDVAHMKVRCPLAYMRKLDNDEVIAYSRTSLLHVYENLYYEESGDDNGSGSKKAKGEQPRRKAFVSRWLLDPAARTFERIDFLPHPLKCPHTTYNTWSGFAVERAGVLDLAPQGDAAPFLDHIRLMADDVAKDSAYIVAWLAHIVQRPGELSGTALVLMSQQGCGKNIALDGFADIIGGEYYHETADPENTLLARFATGRKHKLLINVDETEGRVAFRNSARLKNMITSKYVQYEAKGVDGITLRNVARYVFTSNEDLPVKIEDGDRRYAVFRCSERRRGDAAYFSGFAKYLSEPRNRAAIFVHLRDLDISGMNWERDRPSTLLYRELRYKCTELPLKFLESLLAQRGARDDDDDDDDGDGDTPNGADGVTAGEPDAASASSDVVHYTATLLFEQFQRWVRTTGAPAAWTATAFGTKLRRYVEESRGAIVKRSGGTNNNYDIDFALLRDFLASKGALEPALDPAEGTLPSKGDA